MSSTEPPAPPDPEFSGPQWPRFDGAGDRGAEGLFDAGAEYVPVTPLLPEDPPKVGDFWLGAANQSETDVRMFGHSMTRIEYSDYKLCAKEPDCLSAADNLPASGEK